MVEKSATEQPGLNLPARFIPVPKSISTEAQAFLANSNAVQHQKPPPHHDRKAWRAHIDSANIALTQLAKGFAQNYPVAINEHALSHSTLYEVQPRESTLVAHRALLYVHGGGFTVGHGIAAAYAAAPAANMTRLPAYSIDYRMPPDHPFPVGLDDCVEAYRFLLQRFDAKHIGVIGASAGGGLAASLLLKARDQGLPLPAACVLQTPEVDLTESGDTFETNDTIDVVLKHRLTESILLYANGHDLRDPYLSPLFGDFTKGFAPTLLLSGTRDLFLSNTVRLHRALRRSGIPTELHIWEAMPHGGFFGAPEDAEAADEQVQFLRRHLTLSDMA